MKQKVVYVARHCCMRVIKQALCLRDRYDLHLVSEKITQYADMAFKTMMQAPSMDHLYRCIKMHEDADMFHVHNEPSFYVTVCKEIFPDKPVILDVHDTMLSRWTPEQIEKDETDELFRISQDERININLADGLIFVCKPHQEQVNEAYNVKNKPQAITYSAVPEMFYRIDYGKWLGGVCYEGRIDAPGVLGEGAKWGFFNYSDYRQAAKEFGEAGLPFTIYTPRSNVPIRKEYSELCHVHEPLRYDHLIKAIGAHDWGLVGNVFNHPQWDIAIPNKLFEHQAAMLPTVSINAKECSGFLNETGFGITVANVGELKERWGELWKCRENLAKHRLDYTMEHYIHNTEGVYKGMLV